MTQLAGAIDFSARGNSGDYVLEGWGEAEAGHRWTLGRQSLVRLPAADLGPDCVLVIDATPCLCPPELAGQVVMLALGGRLLATVELRGLRVTSFPLPPGLPPGETVLSLDHLSSGRGRAPEQMRDGQPLGLMVHSLRVFRLDAAERSAVGGAGPGGLRPGPSVRAEAERRTGLTLPALAERFESIGQGCQFGLVQRQCGAEPLGLLRFVDTVTSRLVDGLVAGFAGVEDPDHLTLEPTEDAEPRLRWRQTDYGLTYDTRLLAAGADWEAVRHRQAQRLSFLRRKFAEDVAAAEKMFVLTRGDCLSPSEALAVSCALRLHGPATLLWTTIGHPPAAGQVDRLAPGFLRGELGEVDAHAYAPLEVWLAVMGNAVGVSG